MRTTALVTRGGKGFQGLRRGLCGLCAILTEEMDSGFVDCVSP